MMGHLKSSISLLVLACVVAPSLQCIHVFRPQQATPCSSEPCQNGGACFDDGVENYACVCPTGYSGTNCETENSCSSSPCMNGACSPVDDGYTCECEPGYTGVNCDLIANPCSSYPCLNDGECIPAAGGDYSCICEPGYIGSNCDTAIECPNNMVFNGCALYCGPARCGVTIDSCIGQCDPKCDCPQNTMLCPELMQPIDTCVSNCTVCYNP